MTPPAERDPQALTDAECVAIVHASIDPDRVLNGRTARDGFPADVLLETIERILADRLSARPAATTDTAAQALRDAAEWVDTFAKSLADTGQREAQTAVETCATVLRTWPLEPGTRTAHRDTAHHGEGA